MEDRDDNALPSYLRSIRRASTFRNLQPRLRRIVLGSNEEVSHEHGHTNYHESENESNGPEHEIGHGTADEETHLISSDGHRSSSISSSNSTFDPLHTHVSGSSSSRLQHLASQRETSAQKQNPSSSGQNQNQNQDPNALLTTKVRRPDDRTEAEVIPGQSTLPQTMFNSSNVLIGVGILSLPLGIRYAGWIPGLTGLLLSALVTKYTAGLLAKCMDVDASLANFADIAFVAFGEGGRVVVSGVVTLELMVACVGLVVLFADTVGALVEGLEPWVWKVVCGGVLAPLQFLPLSMLGFTSLLGVFCNIIILFVAIVAGIIKPHSPGSLREVATTYAFPKHWKALPLSFGLIMALWSGHSVFPNVYRDMRHPPKYANALTYTFSFVTSVDILLAVIGYLLYGENTLDEITTNMIKTEGYSRALKIVILIAVAIVPITKFPLHAAPIVSTLEVFTGIDERAALLKPNRLNQNKFLTKAAKAFFRLLVAVIAVLIAIAFPSFELVSALMGGLFGFLICVILPLVFHLKIFQGQVTRRQVVWDWVYILISTVLAVVGTVWEFLPRGWMGL